MQTEFVQAPRRKKKWIVIGGIFLIVLIVAINIAVVQGKKNGIQTTLKFSTAAQRTITNTKLISGRVVPGNIETIYADATKGKVKDIFVKEGDEIQKGQKLFSYDSPDIALQLKQADLDKKMTDMRYQQTQEKIDSLEQSVQKAKDAGADSSALQLQINDAQDQLKTIDLEKQKNDLQQQQLQNKQNDLIVYSHSSGIVQKLDPDATQTSTQAIAQPKAFIQIASKDPYQIQGTVTELQKAQIQKGQAVSITAKAISNKTWKGKITEVSDYPTTADSGQLQAADTQQQQQTVSYYTYKASLDSQDGLSPGYHVALQVNLSAKQMLAVPRSSIVEENNSSYLFIADNGKLRKTKVTTGTTDGDWIEIVEGVKEGDKVVENPSSKVQDGMEVKA